MVRARVLSLPIAGFAAAALGSSVTAAPVAAPVQAQATTVILHPATLVRLNDLDFGSLSVTTPGTATIDPNNDSMSVTGGVLPVAGTPASAHLQIAATRAALVIVHIPAAPITIRRFGGTETMTVSNWTLDGFPIRIIPPNGILDIHVGARLTVAANQAGGDYAGNFDVTTDYF